MIEILEIKPQNHAELLEAIAYFTRRKADTYSGEQKYYDIAIKAIREKAGEA